MKKDILTVLGCSSSLVFAVLTTHPAAANTLTPNSVGSISTRSNGIPVTKVSVLQKKAQFTSLDPMSDTIGDVAIDKLGCDCPGCRTQVMQMIQSGQL